METYRRLLDIAPANRDHRALEQLLPDQRARAGPRRAPGAGLPGARRLPAPRRECTRSRSGTRWTTTGRSLFCRRSPPPRRSAGRAREGLRRARPGAGGGSAGGRTQRRIERLARGLGKLDDLVSRYESPGGAGPLPTRSSRTPSITRWRGWPKRELGRDDQAAAAYLQRPPGPRRRDIAAADALEQIYVRNANYAQLVRLYLRKMAMVEELAEKKTAGLQGGQDPRGGAGQRGQEHRRLPPDPGAGRERRHRPGEPRAPVHPAGTLGGPQGHLRAQGGPGLRPGRRSGRCCSCWGRSTTASWATRPRRSRPTTRSWISDANDYEALQALDRLYAHTERWFDLLSVLERETELSPVAGGGAVAAVPHR